MERSDNYKQKIKTYVMYLTLLEFIKDKNLINDLEYKKIKINIENEFKQYTLNNSDYSYI